MKWRALDKENQALGIINQCSQVPPKWEEISRWNLNPVMPTGCPNWLETQKTQERKITITELKHRKENLPSSPYRESIEVISLTDMGKLKHSKLFEEEVVH